MILPVFANSCVPQNPVKHGGRSQLSISTTCEYTSCGIPAAETPPPAAAPRRRRRSPTRSPPPSRRSPRPSAGTAVARSSAPQPPERNWAAPTRRRPWPASRISRVDPRRGSYKLFENIEYLICPRAISAIWRHLWFETLGGDSILEF